jgi:hypothetical protein
MLRAVEGLLLADQLRRSVTQLHCCDVVFESAALSNETPTMNRFWTNCCPCEGIILLSWQCEYPLKLYVKCLSSSCPEFESQLCCVLNCVGHCLFPGLYIYNIRHFWNFFLVSELLDVVILTERIQRLYVLYLLLILMTGIILGFIVSSVQLISDSLTGKDTEGIGDCVFWGTT